ncbi:MAG: tyrosine-type recombinase/integrase, partial [Ardenticatenaceae bacterium]
MRERIDKYLRHLLEKKRYSQNTIAAYRNDLGQFVEWLEAEGRAGGSWASVTGQDIAAYLFFLREREYAPSTVARKMAAVKSFCHHLMDQEELHEDPTEDVDTPKVKKYAPTALSDEDVRRLLAEPARLENSKGLRDRAMLEMLYGTGLRVSELVSLMLDDLDLERWLVRCGSGQNERVVPVSVRAMGALTAYLNHESGRAKLARNEEEHTLFLNLRGNQLTRQGLWLI